MNENSETLLSFLRDLMAEAGPIAAAQFQKEKTIHAKEDNDVVTETDRELEILIKDRIRKAYPHHQVIGEEFGAEGPESECVWYVDPIDGTRNFAAGIPHFNISIGLLRGGKPWAGAVCDPLHGELFLARKGGGAFLNGKKIQCSVKADMETAFILVDYSPKALKKYAPERLEKIWRTPNRIRVFGALAMDICYAACGRLDALLTLDYKAHNLHDVAAAVLIAAEAGCELLSPDGSHYTFDSPGILVCGPNLKNPLLELLR